jgi:vitamin K-dependent gamma-carboxylase-like protein
VTAVDMTSRRAGLLARVDELLGRRVSMRSLALLRIVAGLVVLLHLRPFLVDAAHGRIYGDAFYQPYVSWYPDLPRSLYIALLLIGAAAAIAMSVGLWTRLTTVTTFAVVAYNFFLSTTHFHNNRAYLFIVLAVLAVAPCGRELSIDAWARGRRGLPPLDPTAPGWPLWLLRFEASAIYGASGLSKLLDPDWFGGAVTWDRLVQSKDKLTATPLPSWVVSALTDRTVHVYAAKLVVLTELFIAIGLWWRGTRYAAVWVAVCFHLSIEASADVEVFSYLGIAALVIWAVPSTRDRMLGMDLSAAGQRWLATAVRRLDWLARFRVDETRSGPVRVVDRDGRVFRGGPAVVFVLSRLPLTAWFSLPVLLLLRGAATREWTGDQAPEDPGLRG